MCSLPAAEHSAEVKRRLVFLDGCGRLAFQRAATLEAAITILHHSVNTNATRETKKKKEECSADHQQANFEVRFFCRILGRRVVECRSGKCWRWRVPDIACTSSSFSLLRRRLLLRLHFTLSSLTRYPHSTLISNTHITTPFAHPRSR